MARGTGGSPCCGTSSFVHNATALLVLAVSIVALLAVLAASPQSDAGTGDAVSDQGSYDYEGFYASYKCQEDNVHYMLYLDPIGEEVRIPDFSTTERPTWEKDSRFKLVDEVCFDSYPDAGFSYIGAYAFSGCSSLKCVTFEDEDYNDETDEIGAYAFADCINLENIRIKGDLMYDDHTFSNDVEKIGKYAFLNCKSLKYVGFASQFLHSSEIKSIGEGAFYGSGLTGFYIRSTITYIGPGAFGNCPDFPGPSNDSKHFSVRDGVLFQGSTLLQFPGAKGGVYEVPDGVTVADYAFAGCYRLTELRIGDIAAASEHSFEGLHLQAFYGGLDLRETGEISSMTFYSDPDSDHVYYSPDGVTGDCFFVYNQSMLQMRVFGTGGMGDYSADSPAPWHSLADQLSAVGIGAGVTNIGDYAFAGCRGLVVVTFGSGYTVTSVGAHAFEGCSRLLSADFAGGGLAKVTSIGASAFSGCDNEGFSGFTIPSGVTSVGEDAFRGCTHLASVTFAGIDVTSIGPGAFYGCSSLSSGFTSLALPKLTSIGASAFERCYSLASFEVPAAVTSLGDGAFRDCSGLVGLTFAGSSLVSVGAHAFSGCSSLSSDGFTTLALSRVTSIGSSAFSGCSGLTSFVIPLGVTAVEDGTFRGCSSLAAASVPSSVTSIGREAFMNCGLTSLELPSSLTSLGAYSFQACSSLTSVSMPGVESVGDYAFSQCMRLARAEYPATAVIGKGAFCVTAASVAAVEQQTYDGTAKTPGLTITWNGAVLTPGVDYAASYYDNVDAGTARYSVAGRGHFSGSLDGGFVILPKGISAADFYVDTSPETYTGSAVTKEITPATGLVEGRDYTVTFSDNVNAGTARIAVLGRGNCTGVLDFEFVIVPRGLTLPGAAAVGRAYDGTEDVTAQVTLGDLSGVIGSDDVRVRQGWTAHVSYARVGTYAVWFTDLELDGRSAPNYTLSVPDLRLTISARDLRVTVVDGKFADGSVLGHVLTDEDVDGLVFGAFLTSGAVETASAEPGVYRDKGAGWVITEPLATSDGIGNYRVEFTVTLYIFEKLTVLVYPDAGQSKTFGEADPTLTYTYVNVYGELEPGFAGSLSRDEGEDAGGYAITKGDLRLVDRGEFVADRYELVFYDGVEFTVLPKTVTTDDFEVDTSSETYTGSAITKDITSELVLDTDYAVTYYDNVDAGEAKILVEGRGNYTGTLTYTFVILPRNITSDDFEVDTSSEVYTGSAVTKTVTPLTGLVLDTDYSVHYSDNVDAGRAAITVTGTGNYTGTLTYAFTILPRTVTSDNFEVDTSSEVYTGSEITKDVTSKLAPGTDYTVTYYDNVDAGDAKIIIEGRGNYTGALTCGFEITPRELTLPDAAAVGRAYDGTADVTAQVTLGDLSGVIGSDDVRVRQGWTASVSSANVGGYAVRFAGLGLDGRSAPNYTLSAPELTLTISARDLRVTVVDGKITDGSVLSHVLTADDVAGLVSGASLISGAVETASAEPGVYRDKGTGWVVSVPLETSDGIGNYRVEFTVALYIFEKLTVLVYPDAGQSKVFGESDPALTYSYVNVYGELEPGFDGSLSRDEGEDAGGYAITRGDLRLVDRGEFVADRYELVFYDGVQFTVLPKTVTTDDFEVDTSDATYTGSAITKDITSELVPGTDYTVTYYDNVNAGTAHVAIRGIGNYAGTLTYGFTILPKEVAAGDFEVDTDPVTYTGSEITKRITSRLVPGTDYAVSYENNLNVGAARITIEGRGNYTGTLTYSFAILPKEVAAGDFEVDTDPVTYTGSAVTKTVTPLTGLVLGTDYAVTYSDNVNAGAAHVLIEGRGNYTGALTYEFRINPRAITADDFYVDTSPEVYTGSEITKTITSPAGLVPGTDYAVSYENNLNVGAAKITIEGRGNYTGALTYEFRINPRAITADDFYVDTSSETYTGSEITKTITSPAGLVPGTDYAATYSDNVDAGTAHVLIEGKGNYAGTLTYTFAILPRTVTSDDFQVDTSSETYTGSEITKTITSPAGLVLGTDYAATYYDNVNAGDAKILVEGRGNHTGTLTYSFAILKRTVDVPDELYYVHTGSEITFGIPGSLYWKETTGHARVGTDAGTYTYFLELDPSCVWSDPSFTGTYHVYVTLEYVSHVDVRGVTDVMVTSPTGVRADYSLVVSYPGVSDVGGYGFGGCTPRYVYDVKVLDADGREVTGPYTLTLLVPGDLLGSVCDVYHVHGGAAERMASTFGGSYVTVSSPGFSDFVLVSRAASGSQPVLAAVLVAAALVAVTAGLAYATSRRML